MGRNSTKPHPLTTAPAGAFLVLLLGLAPFVQSGYMLAGALDLVGHRGVFTAAGCHPTGTGKSRHNVCEGELAAPHRPTRYASVDAAVPLLRATPVQVLPTGSLETVGPAAVTGWSALGLGGLTVMTAGSLAALHKGRGPLPRRTRVRILLVPAAPALAAFVVYVVVRAVA